MGRNPDNRVMISKSEWKIMQVLWDESPLRMGEIVDALKHSKWKRTTIQTMVNRLVAKGFIETDRKGYAFLYYPKVKEKKQKAATSKEFVDEIYNGSLAGFIEGYLSLEKLSSEEKEKIKELIK